MGLFSFYQIAETDPTAFWLSLALVGAFGVGVYGLWTGFLVPASFLVWGSLRGYLYYLEDVSVGIALSSSLEFWVRIP